MLLDEDFYFFLLIYKILMISHGKLIFTMVQWNGISALLNTYSLKNLNLKSIRSNFHLTFNSNTMNLFV